MSEIAPRCNLNTSKWPIGPISLWKVTYNWLVPPSPPTSTVTIFWYSLQETSSILNIHPCQTVEWSFFFFSMIVFLQVSRKMLCNYRNYSIQPWRFLNLFKKNVLLKKTAICKSNFCSCGYKNVDRVNLLPGDFLRFLKNFCDANGPEFSDIVGVNFFISFSYIKLWKN